MTNPHTSPGTAPPSDGSPPSNDQAPPAGYPAHAHAVRLYGPQFANNPGMLYRQMRQQHGPVAPVLLEGDVPAWLVLGYRELHYVTSSPQTFTRDSRCWNAWELIPDDWPLMPFVAWNSSLMFAEGEDHQRRSEAISDALDGVDRTELAAICERVADRLIDAFAGRGEADLIAHYAPQIPLLVVVTLFGFPDADMPAFFQDVTTSMSQSDEANEAYQRVSAKMQQLVRDKRERPGSDALSHLLTHPAGVTDEEATFDVIGLMAAAQSTGDWIGNTLWLMLVDDQFSVNLQGGRSSAGQALNEVLWEEPPVQSVPTCWAVHDCALGNQRIRRGDLIVLGLAAANTDPQVRPDSYADSGANRAHMSFSHGEHRCPVPASETAEIIARMAIEVLLDRLPDVELAVAADTLQWRPSVWARGLFSLPVTFTPGAPIS